MKNLNEISLTIEELKYFIQIKDIEGIKNTLIKNYIFINEENYKPFIKYAHYLVKHITLTEMVYRLLLLELYDLDLTEENLIYHDYSKFSKVEFLTYTNYFYNEKDKNEDDFKKAWNKHQKQNRHHWQYWLLIEDNGKMIPLEMDHKKVVEMIADWISAGYCITKRLDVFDWYKNNKNQIILHSNTRKFLEESLTEIEKNKSFYKSTLEEIADSMRGLYKDIDV